MLRFQRLAHDGEKVTIACTTEDASGIKYRIKDKWLYIKEKAHSIWADLHNVSGVARRKLKVESVEERKMKLQRALDERLGLKYVWKKNGVVIDREIAKMLRFRVDLQLFHCSNLIIEDLSPRRAEIPADQRQRQRRV